ncbi:hypothetical protein ACLK18_14220 [Escherichia coli]
MGRIHELRTKAEFVRISGAGIQESHVHDVTITQQSPTTVWAPDSPSPELSCR